MSASVQVEKSVIEALFSGLKSQNNSITVPSIKLKISDHTSCYYKVNASENVKNKTREIFNRIPQVVVHRTHGWTTDTERKNFVSLWAGGISQKEIAQKFAVSILTVNKYCLLAAKSR